MAVAAAAAGRAIFPALRRGGRSFKGVHIFSDLVSASSVVPGFLVAKLGSILLCEVLLLFSSLPRFRPSLMIHASGELIISVFGSRCDLAVAATSASVPGILKISLEQDCELIQM